LMTWQIGGGHWLPRLNRRGEAERRALRTHSQPEP
jgi:hypothetical protein